MHTVWTPFCLALANAGSNRLARIAMMAITTSSSIRVNPCRLDVFMAACGLKMR